MRRSLRCMAVGLVVVGCVGCSVPASDEPLSEWEHSQSPCPEEYDVFADISEVVPGWPTSLLAEAAILQSRQSCYMAGVGSFELELEIIDEEVLILAVEDYLEPDTCTYYQSAGVVINLEGPDWQETVVPHYASFRLTADGDVASWRAYVEEYYSDVFPASGASFDDQAFIQLFGLWEIGVESSASTNVDIWPLDGEPLASYSCQ